MAAYSIGEAEELTGVRQNILRYWEENIPGLAPRKDIGGRRVYTDRDIDLILRLKYLIQEKRYTLEGARAQLLSEMTGYDRNAKALDAIRELRSNLTELYMTVRKYRSRK
ncbi:MAG: MerR family transcriptional regulator [Treponema sp.]|nr:MerR family transcriptional regulator [Treponema sp.]